MENLLNSLGNGLTGILNSIQERRLYDADDDDEMLADNEEDTDDDDDEEDEMEQIGRLPRGFFNRRISFDYTNWLFARYLAPHGEPSAIIPAMEPEVVPPIPPINPRDRVSRSPSCSHAPTTHQSQIEVTEEQIRTAIRELKTRGVSDREIDLEIQRLMSESYYRRFQKVPERPRDADTVTAADRQPTFNEENGVLGCEHYRRACKIQCSTCNRWFTCRMCHDNEVPDHKLVRPATKHIICMVCGTDQPASNKCVNCTKRFANYFCNVCKLWDDDPNKNIYHCQGCKICRIGEGLGVDLFHCDKCNICMSIELQGNHRCIENNAERDCPICGEFMFTSTNTILFLKCGHSIHQSCYHEHVKSSYKCPTCQRSIINMAAQFRILDQEIQSQPLPDPYCDWRCIIICNDCHGKSNVPFHFLGLKCSNCRSYNTGQLKLIKPEELKEQSVNDLMIRETVDVSELPSAEEFDEEEEEQYQQVFENLLSRVTY